jgi:hypothetical protein
MRVRSALVLALVVLLSCKNRGESAIGETAISETDTQHTDTIDTHDTSGIDADDDGYGVGQDCDDHDATVNPGADELCDGVDQDCDGIIDDGLATSTWYHDTDADGFGDGSTAVEGCEAPDVDWVSDGSDCDDTVQDVHPGALEVCDGIDNDCNGGIDDVADLPFWYTDGDGDGHGDPGTGVQACEAPPGTVDRGDDCDDTDDTVFPGAPELDCNDPVDRNCDGSVGSVDVDGDGTLACEGDCDDADPTINPGADEVCDGVDQDCNGIADDDATDASTWLPDGDGDGYGDDAAPILACEAPSGTVDVGGDCNDADGAIHPGAAEACTDTVDRNCDGFVGTGDNDGDGFAACEECDDGDAAVHPGADELCDGVDDDCDGTVDVGATDAPTWHPDVDGDGYGDGGITATACDAPAGYVADGTDCDDANDAIHPDASETDCADPVDYNCDGSVGSVDADGDGFFACEECDDGDAAVHPGATEVCDGVDDDCDGVGDLTTPWYTDGDGDGYGDPATAVDACAAPSGTIATGGDCDDTDPAYHPGAPETCTDTADFNCDGSIGFTDADGDGFAACEECDDGDAAVNPGAIEACNGVDDDCDGTTDLGAVDAGDWHPDTDGDGFGDGSATDVACDAPSGDVADGTDCNDGDAAYHPGAPETCTDTEDFNCDGSAGFVDADGDGFAACLDCDDGNGAVNPAATEVCNGLDDDCDGTTDQGAADQTTWYVDADGDGYGDDALAITACDAPSGTVAFGGDCDDGDDTIHPGALESCFDAVDLNCDGSVGAVDLDQDGEIACVDCDDSDPLVNSSATEVCNGHDDDCDGQVDESSSADAADFYADTDVDGYGDAGTIAHACSAPTGYVADGTDCDDAEVTTHPGAPERCDGVDDDCDGNVDEDAIDPLTWYTDADDDGFGDPATAVDACDPPAGTVDDATDCDDTDGNVHPGAPETDCTDPTDYDCDGQVAYADVDQDGIPACLDCDDTDAGVSDTIAWYADTDGDGFGDDNAVTMTCLAPSGTVAVGGDCDDSDAAYHPGAAEACDDPNDYDCDGQVAYVDSDGDGFAACVDCDDDGAAVNPGATEVCNGVDDDCDGTTDVGAADPTVWYGDGDGDGYGDDADTVTACDAPTGYVPDGGDCDDADSAYHPNAAETDCTDPADYNCDGSTGFADVDGDGFAACVECDDDVAAVHPGATEVCNGVDDDCEGGIDEGVKSTFYRDQDGDTYGNAASTTQACAAPGGYVSDSTDCNDAVTTTHPNAPELCNGVDDDCDTVVDETPVDRATWYADTDGDGFGDAGSTVLACTQPQGYVANSTDCNDNAAAVNPAATEVCNGIDDDCDGATDEGVKTTFYRDQDGDTYGSATNTTQACTLPSGYVANSTDCNDNAAAVNPAATEVCNGVDDDCDAQVDEGVKTTFYRDLDGDTYGNAASTVQRCSAPSGYVANSTDCNDNAAAIHPNATEVCNGVDDDCDTQVDEGVKSTFYRDVDGDAYGDVATTTQACAAPSGYVANSTDCNDAVASIHPNATEVCNGIDDDCDTQIDEGAKSTFYRDFDGDTYGDLATTVQACSAPSGYVANSADCNDNAAAIHPNATEVCNGIDDDCDGAIDEGVKTTFYQDSDGDGFGNSGATLQACTQPQGYVANSTDCNDGNVAIHPGATEVCNGVDDDCDTQVDEGVKTTFYRDQDGDTYGSATNTTQACSVPSGYVSDSTDCNDNAASVHPNATEVCNGVDDDCDTQVDEGVKTTFYRDQDGDTYGSATNTTQACSVPSGYVSDSTDCNDNAASVHPNATEVCNSVDDDCDTQVDEGVKSTFYQDSDNDTYGNVAVTTQACTAPNGYVANSTDCNDNASTVHPNATELCNGVDDDCDSQIDEGVKTTFYQDFDGDAYGNVAVTQQACTAPSGYVANSTDCNDANVAIHPNATEVCNGIDDDCDTQIDEGVKTTFYQDFDGDTYGNAAVSQQACSAPNGYVANSTDCNDTNVAIHPNATEICNGVDDDCDTQIDEGVKTTFYRDSDGDGFGNANNTTQACSVPSGYVANSTDCNDAVAAINPNATEVCNGVDDDCDTQIDEGVKTTFYRDSDGDTFGNASNTTQACSAPSGYVANSTDCDDTRSGVHPGATEVCNGLDDDCDTQVDEGVKSTFYQDSDNDTYGNSAVTTQACSAPNGYVADSTDCNDNVGSIHPNATEVCNGVDDDCDTQIDEGVKTTFYLDFDNDGYGGTSESTQACSVPSGYSAVNTDCNDAVASIHPNAAETCNLVDDDCDGSIDEGVQTTFYTDADGDGYGDPAVPVAACTQPAGTVANSTDCDDTRVAVNPGATETCNGLDDDCDTVVDEGVTNKYYRDADNDAFGNTAISVNACTQPAGYVSNKTDCNDANKYVLPGGVEMCDGLSNNCTTAGSWTTASEAGRVSWENGTTWTNVTSSFTGTYVMPTSGTVWVCQGSYAVHVSVTGTGDVALTGRRGASVTTLDGSATGSVLASTAGAGSDVVVTGLTLTNGAAANGGGALQNAANATLTLSSCVVDSNTATASGGGIANLAGTMALISTDITDNTAAITGGGAYNADSMTFTGGSVADNVATAQGGGGIYNTGASLQADGTAITGNAGNATYTLIGGGGVANAANGTTELLNCTLSGNSAYNGGAIDNDLGRVTISGTSVAANTAVSGGGVRNKSAFTADTSSILFGNSSTTRGGGVYQEAGSSTLTGITIAANSSVAAGGIGVAGGTVSASQVTMDPDNTPNDVKPTGGIAYAYGANASFACTSTICN